MHWQLPKCLFHFYRSIKTMKKLTLVFAVLFPFAVVAGPYTNTKNKACPEDWESTTKVIPVISSSTDPWDDDSNTDKNTAKSHLERVKPIETLDANPVTSEALVDDLLTVASECLAYRNFEVDTAGYTEPPASQPNTSVGWLPAIF